MIRGMNKKAEDEKSAIGGWVLIILLIVIVAGAMWAFFGPLKGYFNQLSDDLSKTVTSCTLKAKLPDNGASFCKYVSVDFGAGTEYVNCVDSRVTAKLDSATAGAHSCTTDYPTVCKTVVISGGNQTTINGVSVDCAEQVTCANLNGINATTTKIGLTTKGDYSCSDSTKNRLVALGSAATSTISYCCVDPNAA
jgi:hypothetical protein